MGVRLLQQRHGGPGQEVGIEALEILRPKQEEGRVDVHDTVPTFEEGLVSLKEKAVIPELFCSTRVYANIQ